MSLFITFLLAIGVLSQGIASVDEEVLLRTKAALVAKKIHVRNLNLIGVNPVNCQRQDVKKLYIEQMERLQSKSLNHCASLVDPVLKSFNDDIAKVDAGELVYAPVVQITQNPQTFEEEIGGERADRFPEGLNEDSGSNFTPIIATDKASHFTGLTGEEIDRILRSYEGNRKSYATSDEDNLFDILSKAYVRNLNRLLERQVPSD